MGSLGVAEAVTAPVVLGEGPHWSCREQALYYVDIFQQAVHRYHPASNCHSTLRIEGGPVTLVVPHATSTNTLVVSIGSSLASVVWPDPTRGHSISQPSSLALVDVHLPQNRFNDGKCDSRGRLWAGTMGNTDIPDNPQPYKGSLYVLAGKDTIPLVLDKVSISNGLAWSADDNTFYFVDTCRYKVEAFNCDLDQPTLSGRRTVLDYKLAGLYPAFPDGLTIDTQGNLWVASMLSGKVHKINPRTSQVEGWVQVPAGNPTSVCWGGAGLDELYVTTTNKFMSEEQVEKQPNAGAVFRVRGLGVTGPPPRDCTVPLC